MQCVVCKRSPPAVYLIKLLTREICASCKTAYYRKSIKLQDFIAANLNIGIDELEVLDIYQNNSTLMSEIKKLVQKYLSNEELCDKKSTYLKKFECLKKCSHCRFKKALTIFQSIAKLKTISYSDEKKRKL